MEHEQNTVMVYGDISEDPIWKACLDAWCIEHPARDRRKVKRSRRMYRGRVLWKLAERYNLATA